MEGEKWMCTIHLTFKSRLPCTLSVTKIELELLDIPANKIKQLNTEGIFSIEDLVKFFPKEYYDFRNPVKISTITNGLSCAVIAKILNVGEGKKLVYAKVSDGTGVLFINWFNRRYIKNKLECGKYYIFCGSITVNTETGFKNMNPLFWGENFNAYKRLLPKYKKIKGMSSDYLQNIIEKSLCFIKDTDYISICFNKFKKFNLQDRREALIKMHRPISQNDINKAKHRILFDELFEFNFRLKQSQMIKKEHTSFLVKSCKSWTPLYNNLGFDLTQDQKKCLKYLYCKMKAGRTIDALIEGDVGTGKTLIAVFIMAVAAENGFQSCLMAPTETLARQHYDELQERFKGFNLKVGFLSGKSKARERKDIIKKLKEGQLQFLVGTHAVFSEKVEFNNLGLVVCDEQHRFGVLQREAIIGKAYKHPHSIIMSATPIPRTLSMSLYGKSKEIITIKSKPQNRKAIQTISATNDEKSNLYMLQEINKGHQCYVVCPLIEQSKSKLMADVESVTQTYEKIKNYFMENKTVSISLINGNMKQEDINEEIRKFASGKTKILVSTTIVEVGINVPNATVILIKNAERFGLAQLHQLRGRVGRGSFQSYCILQSQKIYDSKIKIMCSTTDGFEISRQDLLLRGSGDFLGTKQSGENKQVMLMLSYPKLYEEINNLTSEIYRNKSLLYKFKQVLG